MKFIALFFIMIGALLVLKSQTVTSASLSYYEAWLSFLNRNRKWLNWFYKFYGIILILIGIGIFLSTLTDFPVNFH